LPFPTGPLFLFWAARVLLSRSRARTVASGLVRGRGFPKTTLSRLGPLLALAVCFLATAAAPAGAELSQRGDLFVSFQGGIAPVALPRSSPAAIAVHVAGTVKTLSGQQPPALRRMSIELNRAGHLDTRGLPVCRLAQIESTSDQQALAACGSALVGGGSYRAVTAFPEQSLFPAVGHILAFNGRDEGGRIILAHIYGPLPAPMTRVVVFRIHPARGAYGAMLTGALPESVNPYGYVTQIALILHRRFTYRGALRSYLSASCAAPAGFPGATFPFARVSMGFADGRTLSSTLVRSCTVRRDR
jgi:hypothetical protein